MPDNFVSGFVSILGRPNAGKSTLLNALVGAKVAIVADKPQTTRTSVQGVWTSPEAQIVFLDTPGIHYSETMFNRRMMSEVRAALEERDLLLYVADVTAPLDTAGEQALEMVKKTGTPVFLVLNKIDRVPDKRQLLPVIEAYSAHCDFAEVIPVSAVKAEGIHELRDTIVGRLPPGPAYFPEDHITDQPERFLAAELIRERVLQETRQEVPHSVAVGIDAWEEKNTLTRIAATIYVERDGQKGIIIGAKGSMLKRIGTESRKEMEKMFGRRIFLELFVKLRPNWRENPEFLKELDWRAMMGSERE